MNEEDQLGYYFSGLIDGEGCFFIGFSHHNGTNTRLDFQVCFGIWLRRDDFEIIELLKKTLDCGNIFYSTQSYRDGQQLPTVSYQVRSVKDLMNFVIPYFEKYPLRGKKKLDFQVFKNAVYMKHRKEHLTKKGFMKLVEMRDGLVLSKGRNIRKYTKQYMTEIYDKVNKVPYEVE